MKRNNQNHHGPAWVYRMYDAAGRLMYVGATVDLFGRLTVHRRGAWWASDVSRVKATVHPTKGEARSVEARAIAEEKPRWNIRHRWPGRASWTAADYDDYLTALELAASTNQAHIANVRRERGVRFRNGGIPA